MGWPRLPTIEEALAWQAWAIATMGAEMFFAIQAARAGASSERPKRPAPKVTADPADEPRLAPALLGATR